MPESDLMVQITLKPPSREMLDGVQKMPLTEELALEHGMLMRIMLAMNTMIKGAEGGRPNMDALSMACDMIRKLVDEHHMKFEEEQIYPRFEKGDMADFVKTLKAQHDEARRFVSQMSQTTKMGQITTSTIENLRRNYTAFQDTLTAHAAFEETLLFPLVRGSISDDELNRLKTAFKEQESRIVGSDPTRKAYTLLSELESKAGINDLSFYTKPSMF
jgi:hemerythrin-like domain-containing protein